MDSEISHICFISDIYNSYTDYIYYLIKCGKEQKIFKIIEEIKINIKGLEILYKSIYFKERIENIIRIINEMEEYLYCNEEFYIFTENRYELENKIKELINGTNEERIKKTIEFILDKLNKINEIFE